MKIKEWRVLISGRNGRRKKKEKKWKDDFSRPCDRLLYLALFIFIFLTLILILILIVSCSVCVMDVAPAAAWVCVRVGLVLFETTFSSPLLPCVQAMPSLHADTSAHAPQPNAPQTGASRWPSSARGSSLQGASVWFLNVRYAAWVCHSWTGCSVVCVSEETLKKNTRSNTFTQGRVRGSERMVSFWWKIWTDDDIENSWVLHRKWINAIPRVRSGVKYWCFIFIWLQLLILWIEEGYKSDGERWISNQKNSRDYFLLLWRRSREMICL